MPFAYIHFVDRQGRPVDPGWGVEGPETQPPGIWPGPGYPDQGLPGGGRPPHVGNRPPGSWFPGGGWGEEHPGNRPPGSWGGGGHAGQLPVWPVEPTHPIAPPIPGEPNPPVDPPPGTIWPPLPPGTPTGKALAMVWIQGVGYRYVVVQIDVRPDQGLPDTGQPPEAQPKRR